MSANPNIYQASAVDRRQFLAATAGLLIAFTLEDGDHPARADGGPATPITAYIRVGADETITILVGGGEMGQGVYSGLAQGVAEELKVDWSRVKIAPIPASQSWLTAGSSGIVRHLQPMRIAGATAREMLIAAAAQTWNAPTSLCTASHGKVTNTATNQSLTYGQLAPLAATLPVPSAPPLTGPAQFRLIGSSVPRPDLPAKTDGSAIYGIDVVLPGMVFAVIKHCPTLGGTLKKTPSVPSGALAVVPLDNAVAVVATNTWQAKEAASQLSVSWNLPATASQVDSAVFQTQALKLLASGTPYTAENRGDTTVGFAKAYRKLEMTYSLPYLAHACMEVLNCTVRLTATRCEIWAPTQAPNSVLKTAMTLTGLPADSIQVTPTFMGGGLGRKFEQDYIAQAIRTAQAVGKPVKLTWPREEDMAHDQYRPMAFSRIRVGLDTGGNIVAWTNRHVSSSLLAQRGVVLGPTGDSQATEGATGLPYAFGSRLIEYVAHPASVPVGFWRSVGHSINAFAVESALDEVALALNADPLALRQKLLSNSSDPLAPHSLAVLNAAATLGGWGTALPSGHARGLALSVAFGSIVAEVAEVSQPTAGSLKIHKVACVIDCGTAINPDSVMAQMQGGIFHGLSAALWGQVTFKAGVASARNFSNYRVLRMSEAPAITVQILPSGAPLGGVGEPGVPPIAPAVANAHARLTGKRVRALPFFPGARMGD